MAVLPKHPGHNSGYDPNQDMTPDQLHRFGKVARKAQKRRDEIARKESLLRSAREAALKPIIVPKKEKPHTVRYVVWLLVIMLCSLWLMYMSG